MILNMEEKEFKIICSALRSEIDLFLAMSRLCNGPDNKVSVINQAVERELLLDRIKALKTS